MTWNTSFAFQSEQNWDVLHHILKELSELALVIVGGCLRLRAK
jgi:hypothetical protein